MITGRNDDQGLVEACRAGRVEAFGVLVRRYQDRLHPTLLRLTGRAEDAEDLLQEAFLRAFEKLDKFHGDSSFYTWIYRIAVNLALSDRRRRRTRSYGRLNEDRDHAADDPPDDPTESDPTLPVLTAERDAQIQSALDGLAADHRAVVVMKDYDGLRYEEIAEVLHVPVGTVRSRLHRARSELRERLRPLLDDEPARMASPERR